MVEFWEDYNATRVKFSDQILVNWTENVRDQLKKLFLTGASSYSYQIPLWTELNDRLILRFIPEGLYIYVQSGTWQGLLAALSCL